MADERIHLDSSADTPIRFALTVDERRRRYGREYPVPPQVGDVFGLQHFTRIVAVTAVHDDGTVDVRPYTSDDAPP